MDEGKRYFKFLRFAFILSWIGGFLLFFLPTIGNTLGEDLLAKILGVVVIALVVSGLMFYYYLSCCVAVLRKSTIVWVGLSFITAPIGPIVAYWKMRGIAIEKGWI